MTSFHSLTTSTQLLLYYIIKSSSYIYEQILLYTNSYSDLQNIIIISIL